MSDKKLIINNRLTNKEKVTRTANIFLIISILGDILFTFYGMLPGSEYGGLFAFGVSFVFCLPSIALKTIAILLNYSRYGDGQHDHKKVLTYRMRAILLIFSVDILSIIVLAIIGRIFGIPYTPGVSGHHIIIHGGAEMLEPLLEIATGLAILSGPAIVLGLVISIVDMIISAKRLKRINLDEKSKQLYNLKKAKNMKGKAQFFLIFSLLVDILCVFLQITDHAPTMIFPFPATVLYYALISAINLSAILLGHFRHNDWQHSGKKFLAYRMEVILLIIVMEITTIIISGIASITNNAIEIMSEMLESFAVLSGPAIILGIIISLIDSMRLKNKIQ